jgi:signal transduction histidine kinase
MAEMSADAPARLAPTVRARNPISRRQVETVVSRSVAVFGIVFAAQTVPNLLGQLDEAQPWWLWAVIIGIFGSLVLATAGSFLRRFVRPSHAIVSIVYVLALATWPLTILPGADIFPGIHWLYYLLTVATACAAVAYNTLFGTLYLVLVPWLYFIGRVMPNGGQAPWELAFLETVYSIILGGAVILIITLLRQASTSVDTAQSGALDRYAYAVRQHALEVERVQVDSIVHDSVLTTLLSAARAETPEAKVLATKMATNAIGHLREAARVGPDEGSTVRVSAVAQRIRDAVEQLSAPFEIHADRLGTSSIPVTAAEAVFSAAVQAAVNSTTHAGQDVPRSINVRVPRGGIQVVVADRGAGFDPAAVPMERLGVRVSILERVANAGGHAAVESTPGGGTTVTIRWPDDQGVHAPLFEEVAPELAQPGPEVAQ